MTYKLNNLFVIKFFLTVVILFSFLLPNGAFAREVKWENTYSGTICYDWRENKYFSGLSNFHVDVKYGVRATDLKTQKVLSDTDVVSVGSQIRFEFLAHDNTDIFWNGTGNTGDTPYGYWIKNAASPGSCKQADFIYRDSNWGANIFIGLSVNPPAKIFRKEGTADVDCKQYGTSNIYNCKVLTAGTFKAHMEIAATSGKFYYSVYQDKFGGCDAAIGAMVPCGSRNRPADFLVSIPAQDVVYDLKTPPICGDAKCEAPLETASSCPADCSVCGNGKCEPPTETNLSCPADCSVCGNGKCEPPTETNLSCPADCSVCGNGKCEPPTETGESCPADCSVCGNDRCESPLETNLSCPADCSVCGNGRCEPPKENANTCPADCIVGGIAPACPSITKLTTTCVAGKPCNFSFFSRDPDSYNIKYGVDWNGGSLYNWGSSISAGTSQTQTRTWTEPGTKYISVVAMDAEGNLSSNCLSSYCVEVGAAASQYVDSGLRLRQGNADSDIVKIAAHRVFNQSSPLRIQTMVDKKTLPTLPLSYANDPLATKIRIMTKNGPELLLKYTEVAVSSDKCPSQVCDFDGRCDLGETYENCPSDCQPVVNNCGNGKCEPEKGETTLSCPVDCKDTPVVPQTFANDYTGDCAPVRPVTGETRIIHNLPGTFTYNIPPEQDQWEAIILQVGAGGGGAGGSVDGKCPGGGGSSGACSIYWFRVRSGEKINITVGSGGKGQQPGLHGDTGTLTSFMYSKFGFTRYVPGGNIPPNNVNTTIRSNGGKSPTGSSCAIAGSQSLPVFEISAGDHSPWRRFENWWPATLTYNSSGPKSMSNWINNRKLPNGKGGDGGDSSTSQIGQKGGDGYSILVVRPCDDACIQGNFLKRW